MKKAFLAVMLVFQVGGLAGCASLLGVPEKPTVDLQRVFVRDSDLAGTTLVFVVDVHNPNSSDLKLKSVSYTVFIAGKELARSKIEKPTLVPANKSIKVEVPLPVKYSSILSSLGDVLLAREVAYRIDGDAKISVFNVPFSKEGKVELR